MSRWATRGGSRRRSKVLIRTGAASQLISHIARGILLEHRLAGKLLRERLPPLIEHGDTLDCHVSVEGCPVHFANDALKLAIGWGDPHKIVNDLVTVRLPGRVQTSE